VYILFPGYGFLVMVFRSKLSPAATSTHLALSTLQNDHGNGLHDNQVLPLAVGKSVSFELAG
jgi:hypothetical protein